ncbi:hypothetical protein RHSIM_Rhsim13G0162100 [Rhododendron simsii]|uniref:Sulfite exporter TauE/SafE family protein n=1 Tax=Rhododendron simsii TaxID=118357 RepID=A0A834L630_RHOSS|nr:hypothetical protein RHSIM_Rhsim13G0162100 [Rhododendron simsii]
MKIFTSLEWVILLPLTIFITFNHSSANQTQPISEIPTLDQLPLTIVQWWMQTHQNTQLKLTVPAVIAGVLCFVAAAISCAGGIGGGGLFIPILTIVAGLDLKTASSFSAFMVTGGSIANVICHMFLKSPKSGGKSLIDYDIALLSEPCMLLGVSVGVICNLVFPEWLITILFAVFLAWSTFKTWIGGLQFGHSMDETWSFGSGLVFFLSSVSSSWQPIWTEEAFLIEVKRMEQKKLQIRLTATVGFLIPSRHKFNRDVGWSIWNRRRNAHKPTSPSSWNSTRTFLAITSDFTDAALFVAQVTAATCSFMVFFSATMSAIQYLLLGMEHTYVALGFAFLCFVASLIGLKVVHSAVEKHGRASLIVFSVSTVMALSAVLITSFGALHVWRDYKSGRYMGFKTPC